MKNKGMPALGRQAVVLLSGGLDSATALYFAKAAGFICSCLIFDYGQRHKKEIASAVAVARKAGAAYRVLKIRLPWKGSSLLDKKSNVPQPQNRLAGRRPNRGIPSTYVPGRNIIFLSFALSYAEACAADTVFIGAHSQDYSGYPDCRPQFLRAFKKAAACGTKAGVEGKAIKVQAPLLNKTKSQIVRLGASLNVPFELTWSCYRGAKEPCRSCDSCFYREKGFKEAGIIDPLMKR